MWLLGTPGWRIPLFKLLRAPWAWGHWSIEHLRMAGTLQVLKAAGIRESRPDWELKALSQILWVTLGDPLWGSVTTHSIPGWVLYQILLIYLLLLQGPGRHSFSYLPCIFALWLAFYFLWCSAAIFFHTTVCMEWVFIYQQIQNSLLLMMYHYSLMSFFLRFWDFCVFQSLWIPTRILRTVFT